jgi:mutator protein MutT
MRGKMVIASCAIILKDKKILLVKRSDSSEVFPKYWGCPGGRVDKGETVEEAVSREVKEEVNLEFKPTELFSTGKWEDRDLNRFLGEWSGEIKLYEEELSDYRWFSYEEAIKLQLGFDYREVIEKLHKKGKL